MYHKFEMHFVFTETESDALKLSQDEIGELVRQFKLLIAVVFVNESTSNDVPHADRLRTLVSSKDANILESMDISLK